MFIFVQDYSYRIERGFKIHSKRPQGFPKKSLLKIIFRIDPRCASQRLREYCNPFFQPLNNLVELIKLGILYFKYIFLWNPHQFSGVFSISIIINNFINIFQSDVFLVVKLVAYNQRVFCPFQKFLIWLILLRILKLFTNLFHLLWLWIDIGQYDKIFILIFLQFFLLFLD